MGHTRLQAQRNRVRKTSGATGHEGGNKLVNACTDMVKIGWGGRGVKLAGGKRGEHLRGGTRERVDMLDVPHTNLLWQIAYAPPMPSPVSPIPS